MKIKLLTLIVVSFSIQTSIAQNAIPNSDFETWIPYGQAPTNYEDPQGWTSSNPSVIFITSPIDKTTDKYSGTYAAEIKAVQLFGTMPVSMLCNGTAPIDMQNYAVDYIKGGTPISINPLQVSGYYKYTRDTAFNDSAFALVILKKYNVAMQKIDTIAVGSLVFATAATYTPFTIPINYLLGNQNADSIVVVFCNQARVMKQMQPIGKLIVDKIKLDTVLTDISEIREDFKIGIYPNPSNGEFTIKGTEEGSYSIVNELGQTVQMIVLSNKNNYTCKVEELANGVYFVVGNNRDTFTKEKVVVVK